MNETTTTATTTTATTTTATTNSVNNGRTPPKVVLLANIFKNNNTNNNNNNNNNGNNHNKCNKCPFRFYIAALGVFACILLCSTRYNLSIAIVSMVQDSCTPNTSLCHNDEYLYDGHPRPSSSSQRSMLIENLLNTSIHCSRKSQFHEPKWSEQQEGFVLGAYYAGFAITHVLGGRFAERFGPKSVTFIGLCGAAFLNAALPWAATTSFELFVTLRVMIGCFHGVVHPALFFMFKNWFPKNEQTSVLSLLLIGNALGLIINIPISAVIKKISLPIPHWSLLFYGGSALHLIWFILWMVYASDIPEQHGHVSEDEIFYIRQNSNNVLETNLHVVPWRRILTSKVLYASIMAKLCWSFNHALIIDNGPLYLNKIFGYDMLQASWQVALIYLATVIVFLLCPPLFAILKHWLPCTHTRLRKLFQAVAFLGVAVTMFVLPRIGCDIRSLQILIILNMITQGFTSAGEYPMINEFAGYYSGTVYGISITFDSLARFSAPIVRGELAQSNKLGDWHVVFYLNAALNLIGLVVFEIFAATSLRSWAMKKEFIRQISSLSDGRIEKPVKKELKLELQNPHYRLDINTETEEWKKFKTSTLVQ